MCSNKELEQGAGAWNLWVITSYTQVMSCVNQYFHRIDKLMYEPAEIPNWVVLIYERRNRFRDEVANRMIADLVRACEAVGRAVKASSTTSSHAES